MYLQQAIIRVVTQRFSPEKALRDDPTNCYEGYYTITQVFFTLRNASPAIPDKIS